MGDSTRRIISRGLSPLSLVPDLPPTPADIYREQVASVVSADHAADPHAAATAQTADRLARIFAAARQQGE